MSPVAKSSPNARTAVLVGLAGVIAAVGLVVLAGFVFGGDDVEVRLGDDRFAVGSAEARARDVAEVQPLLFSDVAGGDRDIIVQHLGDSPEEGWLAFAAAPPGKARDCFLDWQTEDEHFVDCDGEEWPADGEGLPAYPVQVSDDGQLFVDLNAEDRPAETTTTETTILQTGESD